MSDQRIQFLHRNAGFAVLDKPSGVALLADRSGAPCLWDLLPDALGARPLLVHRLDKGTSGVLLVATRADVQRALTRLFQQRRVRKYYLCEASGELEAGRTLDIDLPLRRGRKSRYRVAGLREHIRRHEAGWTLEGPAQDGHASFTRVRVLRHRGGRSLLLAAPRTGRTHQLRVHLCWIGHPLLGDTLYGRPAAAEQQAPRLLLHCHRLVVPGFGSFRAPCPADWEAAG